MMATEDDEHNKANPPHGAAPEGKTNAATTKSAQHADTPVNPNNTDNTNNKTTSDSMVTPPPSPPYSPTSPIYSPETPTYANDSDGAKDTSDQTVDADTNTPGQPDENDLPIDPFAPITPAMLADNERYTGNTPRPPSISDIQFLEDKNKIPAAANEGDMRKTNLDHIILAQAACLQEARAAQQSGPTTEDWPWVWRAYVYHTYIQASLSCGDPNGEYRYATDAFGEHTSPLRATEMSKAARLAAKFTEIVDTQHSSTATTLAIAATVMSDPITQ